MTSTPVMSSINTQALSLMNSVTNNISVTKTGGADFKNFMNLAANAEGQKPEVETKPVVNTEKADTQAQDQTQNETVTAKPTNADNTQKPADNPKEAEVSEEDVTTVDEAIDAIKEVIKDELEITDEELLTALQNLGLNPLALLDTDKLPEIIVEVTEAPDVLSIATDPELYEVLTTVKEETVTQVTELTTELEIPAEDFKEALKITEEVPREAVPEQAEPEEIEVLPREQVARHQDLAEKIQVTVLPKNKETVVEVKTEETEETEDTPVIRTANQVTVKKAESAIESKTETFRPVTKAPETEEHFEIRDKEPSVNPIVDFTKNLLNKAVEAFNEAAEVPASYTEVDVASVISQMTESIQTEISPETTEINLRLHPESLGSVTVKVSQNHEGVMRAQFTTQNESVKAIVESQAIYLKETLESKGVKVEAVEVLVQAHEFERNLSDQNRQNGTNDQQGSKARRIRRINLTEGTEETSEEDTVVREMMAANGNTIDYSA